MTRTISWANRSRQRLMYVGICMLRAAVLIAVALFPSITPGNAVPAASESEAPFEQGESTVKIVVMDQSRPRRHRVQADQGSPLRVQHARKLSITSTQVVPTGHRLPNNLLAPLRC